MHSGFELHGGGSLEMTNSDDLKPLSDSTLSFSSSKREKPFLDSSFALEFSPLFLEFRDSSLEQSYLAVLTQQWLAVSDDGRGRSEASARLQLLAAVFLGCCMFRDAVQLASYDCPRCCCDVSLFLLILNVLKFESGGHSPFLGN